MLKNLKSSIYNIKDTRTITYCSILMAISAILSNFSINIGELIKITFSYIGIAISGFMFGPFVGGIFGGTLDIVQHFIKPTGTYYFVFTLNGIIRGFIYGIILYKKNISFKNIFLARFLTGIIVSIILGTFWINLIYGKGFLSILPLRTIKELILIPIDSFVIYYLLKFLKLKVF